MLEAIVIGLGNIGLNYDLDQSSLYLTHSKCLYFHKSCHLIAGVDISEGARMSFSKEYNVAAYPTISDLSSSNIATANKKIIAISCPTFMHRDISIEAMKLFPGSLVVLEKPCGLSNVQREEIVYKAKQTHCNLVVNTPRRALSYFVSLRDNISKGIERIYSFDGIYYDDFWCNGVHLFDLCSFLTGHYFKKQFLSSSTTLQPTVIGFFGSAFASFRSNKYPNANICRLQIETDSRFIDFDLFSGKILEFRHASLAFNSDYSVVDFTNPVEISNKREDLQLCWYNKLLDKSTMIQKTLTSVNDLINYEKSIYLES